VIDSIKITKIPTIDETRPESVNEANNYDITGMFKTNKIVPNNQIGT